MRVLTAAALAAALVFLTGCSDDDSRPADGSSATAASGTSASDTSATSGGSATTSSGATTGESPAVSGFAPDSRQEEGSSANGSTWAFTVPQVRGGDEQVRDAFNRELDDAAATLNAPAPDAVITVGDGELSSAEKSRTVIERDALSGVIIVLTGTEGAAYPSINVTTVVVDAPTGSVLTLDDIFADPAAARSRLAELAPAADFSGRLADREIIPATLDQWIALEDGLHLYVPVPHVMGDYVPVTLTWDDLADLLTPEARRTLAGA